jgi:hypothetical protein
MATDGYTERFAPARTQQFGCNWSLAVTFKLRFRLANNIRNLYLHVASLRVAADLQSAFRLWKSFAPSGSPPGGARL